MGTRSTTFLHEKKGDKPFMGIYRQFDGYPSGMGADIKTALLGFKITNGFGGDDSKCAKCGHASYSAVHFGNHQAGKREADEKGIRKHIFQMKPIANGMGCLAATLVKRLKQEIGNVYITTPDAEAEAYSYHLYPIGAATGFSTLQSVGVTVIQGEERELYDGPLDELDTTLE